MSCFIVGPDHTDYLITAAIAANIPYGRITWEGQRVEPGNADAVGAGLILANIASVRSRYAHRDDLTTPDTERYSFRPFPDIDPVQTLKAIACYEYQACEDAGWSDSEALRLCEQLRDATISQLPGYDAAQWEVSR